MRKCGGRGLARRLWEWGTLLAAGSLLAGCAPPGARPHRPAEMRTGDLLDRLAARIERVESVRASGRISVEQAGARFDAEHTILFQRPERYRVDVEMKPLLGLFEGRAVAVAEGDSLRVYSPSHGLLFESSCERDLQRLAPEIGWMAMSGLRGVLLGLPDLGDMDALERTVRPDADGLYEVSLWARPGTQTLWLDANTLALERMEIRNDLGIMIASGAYEYGTGEWERPRRVQIKWPTLNAVISLTFSEFEVNAGIDPAVFTLDVPAKVNRIRLGG